MTESPRAQDAAPAAEAAPPAGRNGAGPHLVRSFYGVGVALAVLVVLLWLASTVLLLLFASVLVGVLLFDASARVTRWLPIPRPAALALVVVLALAGLAVGTWLLAPSVAEQARELFKALPDALQRVQEVLQRRGLLDSVAGSLPTPESMASDAASLIGRAGIFFSGMLGALANVVIISVLGIYLALRPAAYVDGIVVLFPLARRGRMREVLGEVGRTLAQWLTGKLLSMLIVGVLTATGLALLQVPLALLLGIVAGLLDFIPYVGPIMAGVPAVLIAFSESPQLALYVVLLFAALQLAEGYLLLPLIERRTVALPPALTISAQVLLGAIFGLAGVALATPIAAVLTVTIAMLYVEDVLGDRVRLPAER
jgi:predicted PurR-regulated permease PerM